MLIHTVINWIARLLSAASLLVLGLFLFGGEESLQIPTVWEAVGFACFPVGVAIGMATGWFHPRLGGLICMGSLFLFYVWHRVTSGSWPSGPYFLIFASPGVLFLIASFLAKSKLQPSS